MRPGTGAATDGWLGHVGVSLLGRVRRLFLVLAWVLLVVEVVELVDADTALLPQRLVAGAGIALAAAATGVLRRSARVAPWYDALAVAAVVAVGWGLGRVGAVLAMLLGLVLLRTLYGTRRSVVVATSALLAAYAVVGLLLYGPAGLLDLGYVVVSVGLGGFAWVLRQVAEAVARHDLAATWDRVLGAAAHDILGASHPAAIDGFLARVVTELDEQGPAAVEGLLTVPTAAAADPTRAPGAPTDELTHDLQRRMGRLWADARVARSLLSSEQRYRRLAEDSRDGIYLRSTPNATAFPYVNAAARCLLGEIDKPGAPGIELGRIHRDDRRALVEALHVGPWVQRPIRVRLLDEAAPDGVRWLELVETPAATVDGRVVTVQGTVRDVTAARHQEEALQRALDHEHQAADRLRHVDELRMTFLAAVSHELRTPLAGLLGASQTLMGRSGRLSAEQSRELAAVVDRQGTRLVSLLDDLLDVERLSRGRVEVSTSPTALLPLARRVVASLDDGGARLLVEGEDAVVLDVDPVHVERILRNLVRNALKHTPASAQVRVLVEPHPHGGLLVVEDDGPGIPPALRPTLFDPFVQGPAAGSSPSPGTGIGLSLVSKFAELHGGRAWVEEAASGGARFVVLLAGASPPPGDGDLDGRVGRGSVTHG